MGALGLLATVDDECLARVLSKQHYSVLGVLLAADGAARGRLAAALKQRSLPVPDMSCMTHILPYKCACCFSLQGTHFRFLHLGGCPIVWLWD